MGSRTNGKPKPAAVVKLPAGTLAAQDITDKAARVRSALDSVWLDDVKWQKIAAVLMGKAMNGDITAAKLMLDYFGASSPSKGNAPDCAVQVNVNGRSKRVQVDDTEL